MASPIDTFKNHLFGQLKTYTDVVQDVFEQRIARPLLAFKRDLNRSSSTTRTSSDREPVIPSEQPTFTSYQESVLASTPLEIIDIESSDSLKTLLDKFKNAFSPSTKRRTSDDVSIDDTELPAKEHRHSSISALSSKTRRKIRLRHKSVSFAEHNTSDQTSPTTNSYSIIEQNEHVPTRTDEINVHTFEENETDFKRDFHQIIRPRRMSIGHGKDLVYQDLAAEIVAYVLKHALRAVEEENEENEALIDLK